MSIYDELLLSESQLAEVKKGQQAFIAAQAAGDRAGMANAHQYVEKIRNSAGYSGGSDGSTYQLLQLNDSPEGYNGYEKLVNQYANGGMNSIAAGYQNTMAELEKEREKIMQESAESQDNARSSAWNVQRMAQEGLLTRGLENTGLANVLTASALNQASANAYQALLDRNQNLREADLAEIDAKADALSKAGELQQDVAAMLTDGYSNFYEDQRNHERELERGEIEYQHQKERDEREYQHNKEINERDYQQKKEMDERDYQQELALAKLAQKYDIDLSKLSADQKRKLLEQEYQYDLAIAKLKHQWEKEKR